MGHVMVSGCCENGWEKKKKVEAFGDEKNMTMGREEILFLNRFAPEFKADHSQSCDCGGQIKLAIA